MGLTHTKNQEKDVAAVLSEFTDTNKAHLGGKPNVTLTRGGSVVELDVLVSDKADAVRLNSDLQQRLMARGIKWQ